MDFTNRIFIVFDVDDVLFAAHSVRAAVSQLIKKGKIYENYIVDFRTHETIKDRLGENWKSILMDMNLDEYNALCGTMRYIGSYSVVED